MESQEGRAGHFVGDGGRGGSVAAVVAVMRSSLLNLWINITFMKDADTAAQFDSVAVQLESDGQVRNQRIVNQVVACIRG